MGEGELGSRCFLACVIDGLLYWLQDLLLSSSEDSESELSEIEQLQIMLELQHKRRKKWTKRLKKEHKVRRPVYIWFRCGVESPSPSLYYAYSQLIRYKYFTAGLLSSKDRYPEHIKQLEEKGLGLRKVLYGQFHHL